MKQIFVAGLLLLLLGLFLLWGYYGRNPPSPKVEAFGGTDVRGGMIHGRGGFGDGQRVGVESVEPWLEKTQLATVGQGRGKGYLELGKTAVCYNVLDFLMNNAQDPWTVKELAAYDNDVVKEQFYALTGVKPTWDKRERITGWVGGRYYGEDGVPNPQVGAVLKYRPKDARDIIRRCYTRGDTGMENVRNNWPYGTYYSRTKNLYDEARKLALKMGLDTLQITNDPCMDGMYRYRIMVLGN